MNHLRSTSVDRTSERWHRIRDNVGATVDVDADMHADGVWLVTRAFESARNTTPRAGTSLDGSAPARGEEAS